MKIRDQNLRIKTPPLTLLARPALAISVALSLAACGGDDKPKVSTNAHQIGTSTVSTTGQKFALFNSLAVPEEAETSRFIVKYKVDSPARKNSSLVQANLNRRVSTLSVGTRYSYRLATGGDVIVTDRALTRAEADAFMKDIYSDPDVEYIEPDVEVTTAMVPNDPSYVRQPAFHNADSYPSGINAEGAWDLANGQGVVIAELDTGVTPHSDLDANVLPGVDILGGQISGDGHDLGSTNCIPAWHGTHVAGTLAASTNNGLGVAGTAWGAKIVPVRVLDSCGRGAISDVATGIIWASGGTVPGAPTNRYPAQVINISIQGNGACSRTAQEAIDSAVSRGATVIIAAGNYNANSATSQPGNCSDVISVAAAAPTGERANFSNYGSLITLAAPGMNVLSTWNSGRSLPSTENYVQMSGTSMAAPHVAGVVALMQSVVSTPLPPAEVRSILTRTARPFPISPDQEIGAGILDAKAAVEMARQTNPAPVAVLTVSASTREMTEETVSVTDRSILKAGTLKSRTLDWGYGRGPSVWTPLTQKTTNLALGEYIGKTLNIKLSVTDSNGMSDSLTVPVTIPIPKYEDVTRGQVVKNIERNLQQYPITARYKLTVPAGATNLTFKTMGGSGPFNLYVRKDLPTFSNPVCSVVSSDPNKTCAIANPAPGDWYAVLYAKGQVSGVSLVGDYETP